MGTTTAPPSPPRSLTPPCAPLPLSALDELCRARASEEACRAEAEAAVARASEACAARLEASARADGAAADADRFRHKYEKYKGLYTPLYEQLVRDRAARKRALAGEPGGGHAGEQPHRRARPAAPQEAPQGKWEVEAQAAEPVQVARATPLPLPLPLPACSPLLPTGPSPARQPSPPAPPRAAFDTVQSDWLPVARGEDGDADERQSPAAVAPAAAHAAAPEPQAFAAAETGAPAADGGPEWKRARHTPRVPALAPGPAAAAAPAPAPSGRPASGPGSDVTQCCDAAAAGRACPHRRGALVQLPFAPPPLPPPARPAPAVTPALSAPMATGRWRVRAAAAARADGEGFISDAAFLPAAPPVQPKPPRPADPGAYRYLFTPPPPAEAGADGVKDAGAGEGEGEGAMPFALASLPPHARTNWSLEPRPRRGAGEQAPRAADAGGGAAAVPPRRALPEVLFDVERRKAVRAAMPTFECAECTRFYDALGLPAPGSCSHAKGGEGPSREAMRQQAGRHRAHWQPALTPAGFWNLGFDPTQPAASNKSQ